MSASSPAMPSQSQPVAAPRQFGKYVLIRKLAEGGMAEIYLAKQTGAEGFERDVVIKCMLEHFTQSPDFVTMFLDEARLAARLHHPNIVQITDLGVADERYFICMEYLAGEDLESLIEATRAQGQPVPIDVACAILLSALEGLDFAHGYQENGRLAGLVHRDISPSNILVTFQGTVKVLDFGIAKASTRMTQTQPGLLKGKLGYMSPEQARGEVELDGRSDVFSLGITFHELLTGRRLFERHHEVGVLLALLQQPIASPATVRPDLPPELDRIVMKALERDLSARYASAAEMRADLEAFARASSAVLGMSQLARYLQGLFGPETVQRKTKIPSLSELDGVATVQPREPGGTERTLVRTPNTGERDGTAAFGARPPSEPRLDGTATFGRPPSEPRPEPTLTFPTPAAPSEPPREPTLAYPTPAAPSPTPPSPLPAATSPAPTPAAPMPAAPTAPVPASPVTVELAAVSPARGLSMMLVGALVTVLLLGLGGGATWYFMSRAAANSVVPSLPPPVAAVQVPPSVPEPVAPEPVAPPPEPQPEPRPTMAPPPDSTPDPRPASEPVRARAIKLTGKEVSAALRKHTERIIQCGAQFRAEIPANGLVKVELTVKNSGEARKVKVSEPPASQLPNMAHCLEQRIARVRYPRNSNQPELVIKLPLRFNKN